MQTGYTEEAGSVVFDLLENDLAGIWEDIQSTPQDSTAERWKQKINKIGQEFSLSSRFALMRILRSRALGYRVTDPSGNSQSAFEMTVNGRQYYFQNVSLQKTQDLSPQEHLQYMDCLLQIADRQAESDSKVNREILYKAWFDEKSANEVAKYQLVEEHAQAEKLYTEAAVRNKQAFKERITRDEALLLGHILDFSLEEMQWFLLRTFDTAEGFHFNRSEDLIEVYGFLTGASWQHVRQLCERFTQISESIPKKDFPERNQKWTRNVSESLFDHIAQWRQHPETMDEQFLSWMAHHAQGLDIPSHTAARIYRNLAAFAYDLMTGDEVIPGEEEFTDCIQDVVTEERDSGAAKRLLYENGSPAYSSCRLLANALLLENKIQSISIQADNTKAWHVLSTRKDGVLTSAGGVVNSGRTRVADILFGKVQAEKADMLYLLWFTANLIWQDHDIPDNNTICCRVLDFMDAAKILLDEALLPEFYVPHPIEQSMLLSIVCGNDEDNPPSVVYEYMLSALTEHRNRKNGSKRHDESFKIEVVKYYRSHKEMTLDECASHFGISVQTLSAWQKTLLEKGKL